MPSSSKKKKIDLIVQVKNAIGGGGDAYLKETDKFQRTDGSGIRENSKHKFYDDREHFSTSKML